MPTWVPFAAKLSALAGVIALLLLVLGATGLVTQAAKGYYNFELGLYAAELFGIQFIDYLLLAVLAMMIHVVVDHKYLGHLLMILYFVFTLFMGQFGFEHNLYRYGSDVGALYSDMNGYGPFLVPFAWYKLYWVAVAVLLALGANLLWVRGKETSASWRLRLAKLRASRGTALAAGTAGALVLVLGGFIFYNTNVLNEYRTDETYELLAAEYEKRYERFEGIPQPRITAVDVNVAIYPEERDLRVRGTYRLMNKSSVPIDSVHIELPRRAAVHELAFDRSAELVHTDEDYGYRIYALEAPLPPGDSLRLRFDVGYVTKGFRNDGPNTAVVANGTFVNSRVLPHIGYNDGAELSEEEAREEHGLEPEPRMAAITDSAALMNNYISRDADWVEFEATVSTAPGQIAIAPGALTRTWMEGDRRYFHYEAQTPILNFYSFLSADYAVERDRWRDVAIEVYYHPGHEYNLDRMIEAVKESLDYYTENFGPYPRDYLRIIEFPRYASFAQSFPGTIPYSEAIGFIARIDEETDIDYPFYVTAHEVAHQWFAHQLISGNVQGATLLSETLSQYAALMVMEEEYGEDQMRKFLEYEMDEYLMGRSFEREKELPLLLVENQPYIHYNKGSVVMYALQDYIGEERLNRAIARYIDHAHDMERPYTNALEFYGYLKRATPDSLQQALEDLFRHITLFDLGATEASYTRTGDGRYAVTLTVEAKKFYADSLGRQIEAPMNTPLDIGVFAPAEGGEELGEPLYLEKRRITAGTDTLRIVVDEKPARAGIDPYHKRLDRHTDDNVVEVDAAG